MSLKGVIRFGRLPLLALVCAASLSTTAVADGDKEWEGMYLGFGLGGGYGIASPDSHISIGYFTAGDPEQVDPGLQESIEDGYLSGSAIAGYDVQRGDWVFGFEASLTASNFSDTNAAGPTSYTSFPAVNFTTRTTIEHDFAFSLRPKIGYALGDVLLHAALGPTIGTFKYKLRYNETGATTNSYSYTDDRVAFGISSNIGAS
ncbi:outer membrane protein [Sneathiella limimaris]|uniref:outer membrane protein n=1 Tax=Sneathiella limimaris TaxID=1964213 RepID=UPI00146C4040|nr:outer membrane beta-barrel protein [Sneathiella limimaris]